MRGFACLELQRSGWCACCSCCCRFSTSSAYHLVRTTSYHLSPYCRHGLLPVPIIPGACGGAWGRSTLAGFCTDWSPAVCNEGVLGFCDCSWIGSVTGLCSRFSVVGTACRLIVSESLFVAQGFGCDDSFIWQNYLVDVMRESISYDSSFHSPRRSSCMYTG